MVYGSVLCEQFRSAVTRIVRVRETEVDQKWFLILRCLAIDQVIHHLIAVPDAAGFVRAASLRGIMTNSKLLIGTFVAVASLARPHRAVASLVKGRQPSCWIQDSVDTVRLRSLHAHSEGATESDRTSPCDAKEYRQLR